MAKFTKLNIGDSVASSGGRVWKKLSAEEPKDDSIAGTWVFNSSVVAPVGDCYLTYPTQNDTTSFGTDIWGNDLYFSAYSSRYSSYSGLTWKSVTTSSVGYFNTGRGQGQTGNYWYEKIANSTITFYEFADDVNVIDVNYKSWLKANATKIA